MAAQPESNEQALRELAERLLGHPHPEGVISIELFVQRLPESLQPDLPLPAGARLWGSQLRRLAGNPALMEAVLDVDGEPSLVLDEYETELTAAGWSMFEGFGPPHGGFVGAGMGEGRLLQLGGAGPVLALSAVARNDAPTDLRIRLDWEMARHRPTGPRGMPPGAELLPPLRPPAGVTMRGPSGSGGSGRWTSETTLQTERPVAELEAHFAAQLARVGWTRTAGNTDGVVGWSAWQLPGDEGWRGVLLVLAAFGPTEPFVSLRIERRESDEPGAAYFISSR